MRGNQYLVRNGYLVRVLGICLVVLACLLGCKETPAPPPTGETPGDSGTKVTPDTPTPRPTPTRTIPPKISPHHWKPTTPRKSKSTDFGTGVIHRRARRLSVRKIKNSIALLFPGIKWEDASGQDLFAKYALTLGQADYLILNDNNNDITKLFMKLMQDMAANVCQKAVARDLQTTPESKRKFVRYENNVDQGLRFVRFKFHGIHIPTSSKDGIERLRALYDKVMAEKQDKDMAWRLVCIAVLTSPQFYVY